MGGTSLALKRRQADTWLTESVFRGVALDIGGASDALSREMFPGLDSVTVIDTALGTDGRDLSLYPDNSIDLTYSSHTLEHIPEYEWALREWWRVVKPGGYMLVVVPDEQYYEQCLWPSRFNADHKHSWSLWKRSPLPRHLNLVPLMLGVIGDTGELERAMRLPWGSTLGLHDNTDVNKAEAGLEVICRKL
jgi:SAM-dependent methyltransferase